MAKDPAFLFYSADFMIGTTFFTMEQRGKYISLLCLQHQIGHLSKAQMLEVCKVEDAEIFEKFKKDPKGFFYNERLESESDRRKAFCESRRLARMSGVEAKEIKKEKRKAEKTQKPAFIPPTLEQVQEYKATRPSSIVNCQRFVDFYTANGWKQNNKKAIVDWKAAFRLWEARDDAPPAMKKRPAALRVIEYRALKWDDRRIMDQLTGEKYTEHEINEAIGKRY